jgi:hypothetical protein
MCNTAGKGFDWGREGACTGMVDHFAFCAVLLVGYFHGGPIGSEEGGKWQGDRENLAIEPKGDITDPELLGAAILRGFDESVFSNP